MATKTPEDKFYLYRANMAIKTPEDNLLFVWSQYGYQNS